MNNNTHKCIVILFSVTLFMSILAGCGKKTVRQDENAATNQSAVVREDTSKAPEKERSADTGQSASASTEVAETGQNSGQMSKLQQKLELELQSDFGDWSICVKRMDTDEMFSLDNHAMRSASLIKLFIAGAYYQAVQDSNVDDTYGDTTDIMLQQSDNAAANTLIDLLGYDYINSFIKSVGASDTVIERKMLEQTKRENYTSVEDCERVLEMILNGTYVNKTVSSKILDDLKKQQRTTKIPAGVPSGVQTANKTGELTGVENDAAIVWGSDCTYILVVMTDSVPDAAEARREITNISEIVYSTLE